MADVIYIGLGQDYLGVKGQEYAGRNRPKLTLGACGTDIYDPMRGRWYLKYARKVQKAVIF